MVDHEEATCLVVIDIINRRSGDKYEITERPDKKNRDSEDIDFIIVAKGNPSIAVEHTSIESFEDQRGLGHRAVRFIERIEKKLQSSLPSNTYYKLTIPVDLVPHTSKGEQRRVESELLTWIPSDIRMLQPHGKPISRDILDGRFTVWLSRGGSATTLNGRLLPFQVAPTNLETQRIDRIEKAMNTKLPKLQIYETKGYETLLILEDVDYALSNSIVVEETVLQLRSKSSLHFPNYIYQLTSFGDDITEGWMLKEQQSWANEIQNRGPFYDFIIS